VIQAPDSDIARDIELEGGGPKRLIERAADVKGVTPLGLSVLALSPASQLSCLPSSLK